LSFLFYLFTCFVGDYWRAQFLSVNQWDGCHHPLLLVGGGRINVLLLLLLQLVL
jgi:hypothetical protein